MDHAASDVGSADTFILSDQDDPPLHHLRGLCFHGVDLIIGDDGYRMFRASRAADIEPGQDGAYIVVTGKDGETIVGTDATGYFKLFLYRSGRSWALSNSLIALARHAASRHLPVTISEPHLASFFIKGAFGNQLTSLHTSVQEIQLVPAAMEAVITSAASDRRIALRPSRAAVGASGHGGTYADALRAYLGLWTGRMATVLQSDLYVVSDLTGGRDSRAVLSLILAASRLVGDGLLGRSHFRSGQKATDDFAIATAIASKLGLNLVNHRRDPRAPQQVDTQQGYEKWKLLCLGVYTPIYFSNTGLVPTAIAFTGVGGEGHRRFYPAVDPETFLQWHRKFIPSGSHFKILTSDILEDLALLRQAHESAVEPMMLHYRHFRDRCHGGRTPQYVNALAPLASGLLRRASGLCSREQIERSQVLADILFNTHPELALMPFDRPEKAFDAGHRTDMLDASEAIASASRDGRVYAGEARPSARGRFKPLDAFGRLRDDFLAHYDEMRKQAFFPADYLETARATVERAAETGRLPHAVDGCAVSHVILAGELSRLSNWERSPSILTKIRAALSWS